MSKALTILACVSLVIVAVVTDSPKHETGQSDLNLAHQMATSTFGPGPLSPFGISGVGSIVHGSLSHESRDRLTANSPVSAVGTGNETSERGQSTKWAKGDVMIAPESGEGAAPASETTVAINPRNPRQVIAGAIDYGYRDVSRPGGARGDWATTIYVSADGGKTWRDKRYVPVREDCWAADPAITFDPTGRAYYAYLDYGCDDGQLSVITSRNGGRTWTLPRIAAHGGELAEGKCVTLDKPYIGSDPTRKTTVYIAWTQVVHECGGPPSGSWPIHFSRSDNGGKTWSKPARVSENEDDVAQGAVPRVGPDGTLYVAYYNATPLSGCPSTIATAVSGTPSSMEMIVAISKDRGATWSHKAVAPVCDNQQQNPEQPLSTNNALSIPALSIDSATGTAYVAWSDRDLPNTTIKVSASTDRGATWSEPVTLQGDPGQSLFMPWLAAVSDGVARLVYVAENSAGLYDVFYRESADGRTWTSPFRLSTETSCACHGSERGPYANLPFIGHYIGMDAAGGVVIAAWPDNRHQEGWQTIYARRGTYGP